VPYRFVPNLDGALATTKLLLVHGADVNAASGAFGTALIAASKRRGVELIHTLLQAGADVDQIDGNNHWTTGKFTYYRPT